jgi:hypothetical protein
MRRWPGIVIVAVATIAFAVAVGYHFQHRVAQAKKSFSVPIGNHALNGIYFPPITDPTGVQTFSGTTAKYGIPFTTNGHFSTWTFKCKCSNNFATLVYNSTNTLIDVPLNEVGSTRLTAVANYPAGHYTMNVMADGPWTINLVDETKLAHVKVPFTYLSSGTSILGPFPNTAAHLTSAYRANLGELFTVEMFGPTGQSYGFKEFTIRTGSRSVVLPGAPNPYFLVVKGTGLWYISVK